MRRNALVNEGKMIAQPQPRPAARRQYTAADLDSMPLEDLAHLARNPENARYTLEPEVPRSTINPNRSRV